MSTATLHNGLGVAPHAMMRKDEVWGTGSLSANNLDLDSWDEKISGEITMDYDHVEPLLDFEASPSSSSMHDNMPVASAVNGSSLASWPQADTGLIEDGKQNDKDIVTPAALTVVQSTPTPVLSASGAATTTIAPSVLMPANVHVDFDISKKETAGATIPVYEGNVLSAIQAAVKPKSKSASSKSKPSVTKAPAVNIKTSSLSTSKNSKDVKVKDVKVKKRPGRKLMDTPTVEDIAKVTDPKERKRLANRKASRECRKRKETQMGQLEEEVQDLRKTKDELTGTVEKLRQENCALSFVREENMRLRKQLAMFEREFGSLNLQTTAAVC